MSARSAAPRGGTRGSGYIDGGDRRIVPFRRRRTPPFDNNNSFRRASCGQCGPGYGSCCPFGKWGLHAAHQPERIRELARAGLHPQLIAVLCGWGLDAIERELRGGPT